MTDRGHRPDGWQLDESGPEAYEEYLVPRMFAPWADRLVDRVGVDASDRVLDVGCGTGIVARRAASRVGDEGSVVGLDTNEGMLDVATASTAEHYPEIEWKRGDATDLPFSDDAFDVVLCQQVIQFVSDPRDAVAEMRRVLAPGGRVAVSAWRPLRFNPGYVELAAALQRHVDDDAEAMMRSPFPAWDRDDLRSIAREADFDEVSVTIEIGSMRYPSIEEFVRREAASSPLSERLAAVETDVREALVADLRDALSEYTDDAGVVFPMETYVLAATR